MVFGTEQERKKGKKKGFDDIDYSLRLKSTKELEEELKGLNKHMK